MKDFPLNDLLSATDLDKIKESLYLIFGHINKKLKVSWVMSLFNHLVATAYVFSNASPYPLRRTLPLVEAISRDFNDQLLKVLNSQRLMFMDYGMFERTMESVGDVFAAWDENIKEFTNVAREGAFYWHSSKVRQP
jgi:dynein heavy chain 1, cytosolic